MKKRDIIPVHEKAIEIIDKAEEANNGDLQLKNEREMRRTRRATKHSPEKIMVDQPESLNKW